MRMSQPVNVRVLERRKDGRGGIVEVPIAPESPVVDFGITAGGGKKGALTVADLREMAANFSRYPGPISVGAGTHDRDPGSAAPGFVEAVELRGSVLYARLDLGPQLFAEVVDQRAWRGFSIEAARNLKKPTVEFEGWVLTGGIFTNAPALDAHFKLPDSIAASVGESAQQRLINVEVSTTNGHDGQETQKMDDTITLASHEAKLAEVKNDLGGKLAAATEQVSSLQTSVATLKDRADKVTVERDRLAAENAALASERDALRATSSHSTAQKDAAIMQLRTERDTLKRSLTESEIREKDALDKVLASDVRRIVTDAIAAGAPPAFFDGFEVDPAMWMRSRYASLESLQLAATSLRGMVKLSGSTTASGSNPNANQETGKKPAVSEEDAEQFARLGIGSGEFVGVKDIATAQKIAAARKSGK